MTPRMADATALASEQVFGGSTKAIQGQDPFRIQTTISCQVEVVDPNKGVNGTITDSVHQCHALDVRKLQVKQKKS